MKAKLFGVICGVAFTSALLQVPVNAQNCSPTGNSGESEDPNDNTSAIINTPTGTGIPLPGGTGDASDPCDTGVTTPGGINVDTSGVGVGVPTNTVPTPAAVLPILTGLFGSAIRKRKKDSREA